MDESLATAQARSGAPNDLSALQYAFSVSAAMMGALALWVPSGYSIGALALLVCSIWVLLQRGMPRLSAMEWLLIGTMLAYSIVWMVDALLRGEGTRGMDQASRFIFAIPVLLGAAQVTVRWKIIWLGVGIGGFGALGIAFYQVYFEGLARASGYIGPEPFGNICALLAAMGILGSLWLQRENHHPAVVLTAAVGGCAAIAALVLSGTRASWLALFPVLLIALVFMWRQIKPRRRLTAAAALFAMVVAAGGFLAEPIEHRVAATYSDVNSYFDGVENPGSVGIRFELWKGSLHLFAQKPWLGWGTNAYRTEMANLAAIGQIKLSSSASKDPARGPNHAHNELFDALGKKGLLGAFLIVSIYAVPGLIFLRCIMRSSNISNQILYTAGLSVVITSGLYGMAHTSLESNAGVMNYAFWIALFVGSFVTARSGNIVDSKATV